jgi:hypothetical protein
VKLAAPGFTSAGVEASLASAWLDRLTSLLTSAGPIKVTTANDLQQVLGLERQRQLVGCESNTSCLAELVGALGVDGILSGSLAKTGSGFLVTLRVVRPNDGTVVVTLSERLADEKQLGAWFEAQAPELARSVLIAFGHPADAALIKRAPAPLSPVVRWVPAIVGGAAAVGGGVCLFIAEQSATKLTTARLDATEIHDTASLGRTTQVLGPVLLGAGAAALFTSVIWAATAGPSTSVAVVPGPGGASITVGGHF